MKYGEKHWKTWKMRNTHCRTWIMERKLKNVENEIKTLYELEYGEKHWKWRKREMHTVGPGICRENWKSWKMRNTNWTWWNMTKTIINSEKWEMFMLGPEYGEKYQNHGKWEIHTVGPVIWRETLKNLQNEKCTL
jgi:hypothetical protein